MEFPRKRATMTDVAHAAKVSLQTVSAVINGKPGISEPTRERVRNVIRQLDYHPNGFASSLRARRSFTVGVVIPTITNPYFPEFVRGIEDVAHRQGYSVFLCNSDHDQRKEISYLQLLRRHRVAGYLVAYGLSNQEGDRILTELAADGIPVVTLGARQLHPKAITLLSDDVHGTARITSHLVEWGHRRIGFISPPEGGAVHRNRSAGYLRALRKAGVSPEPALIVPGDFEVEAGQRGAADLMNVNDPPSAMVAANDLVAIGAINTLRRMGKRVPEDVSVTGYDDIPLARLFHPALTTMAQPVYEMGAAGMSALLARIADPTLEGEIIRFKSKLVVRESSAPPPSASRPQLFPPDHTPP